MLSTDAVVHELYEEDRQLREEILTRWGPEVAPDGVVDRAAVAERAFASAQERTWLEQLLWPLVAARVGAWLEQVRAASARGEVPPRAAVVEVPLLFEAGMAEIYDATIVVVADEGVRRERAARRAHALVDERTARQLSQDEKAQKATFVVRNDGSEDDLAAELSAVLGKLSK